MSRKTIEFIVMLLTAITLTVFDPLGFTNNWDARTTIFAAIGYCIPGAIVALIISKILYFRSS